jgi:hypothetical protein
MACSLAACGGKDGESSDLPSMPESTNSVSSTPTPSTSGTPTAVPSQTTAKYRDLTLVLNRPTAVDPKTEPAVLQFLRIHQLFAVMASGRPAPAELSKIAASAPVNFLNAVLAGDRQAKQRGSGTLTVSVTKAQASASAAVVDGCFNQSKVVTIRANGSRFVDPSVKRDPMFPVRVTLSRGTGTWTISDYAFREGQC